MEMDWNDPEVIQRVRRELARIDQERMDAIFAKHVGGEA